MGFLSALVKPLGGDLPSDSWGQLIGCLVTLPWLCTPALAGCLPGGIQGQEYTQLPAQLCTGYADALLGVQGNREYGSVVCDRPEGSYFFLQRLVRYTPQKQAVWKVVQIKPLARLHQQERAISQGCQQAQAAPDQAILAVVHQDPQQGLIPLRTWRVDFNREALISIDPQTVTCQLDPQPTLGP